MFEDAYLRRGSFDRPAPSRCTPSPIGVASSSATFAHLFAESAAKIPLPEQDRIFVSADIYAWRATDEQAVCASWIGKHAEAFTLCRRLLARPDIPEADRQRIAANRDFSVPAMLEAASPYPEALVQSLAAGPGQAEVTVSLIAGPDRADHRADPELVSELLPRCVTGRALPGARHRPIRPRPRETAAALRVSRVRPSPIRRRARRPARAATRSHRRTVLAAPGRRLAVFRPRELHHPPDGGARRRTTGVSGGHQLRRRGQTHRHQRRRAADPPGTRRRPLPAHRGIGHAAQRCSTPHAWTGPSVSERDPDPPAQRQRPTAGAGLRTASLDEVLCISGLAP